MVLFFIVAVTTLVASVLLSPFWFPVLLGSQCI